MIKKNWPVLNVGSIFVALALFALAAAPLVNPPPVYAATSDCGNGAPNLVQNPGFESVSSTNTTPSKWYITSNEVPHWSKPIGDATNYPWVQTNGAMEIAPSWEGSNSAVILGVNGVIGIAGDLSTPMVVGATYDVSAMVNVVGTGDPATFELRLRQSASGLESAAIAQKTTSAGGGSLSWKVLSATVVPNMSYDQVTVRHTWLGGSNNAGYGIIDDVHVTCKNSGTLPWWKNHGAQAGLVLFALAMIGEFIVWRTRGAGTGGKPKASHVATGDVNGDGKLDDLKVSENQSGRPLDRILHGGNQAVIGLAVLGVAGAAIFVAGASGGIWKSKTNPTTTTDTTMTKQAPTKTPTPAPAKTCVDKETLLEGYKLFRSTKYKYCIQYPSKWMVNSTDPAKVTFGMEPTGEPGPGWFKVTYFSGKTVAMREEEIKANFREPAGPCTTSAVTLSGESGKKLDCIGAANGEHHIFYVVSEAGGNLFELSYIGDMSSSTTSYNAQYKAMINSFLGDMFANK